jgi:dihydrofolate reductase
MRVCVIVAHDPNLVIGHQGGLPWRIKEDLAFFKRTTMGAPIIMGRNVFMDIGGKPLPGRKNIVVSSTLTSKEAQTDVYTTLEDALKAGKVYAEAHSTDLFLIGGRRIYEEGLTMADRLYITEVLETYEGDTTFPEYRQDIDNVWECTSVTPGDEVVYKVYDRKSFT